jgi:pyruvate,water dikinase
MKDQFIVWFKDVGKEDVGLVGGKGANLGEMTNIGIPVPPGFIITAKAFFHFIKTNNLEEKIKKNLKGVDKNLPESYTAVSEKIKKAIIDSPIPKEISIEAVKAYIKLEGVFKSPLVAVRSSATAEDLPFASFAGQQRTFLNVKGEVNLLEAVRECWASLFEPRAIFYREEKGFNHFEVGLAIPIQKMVQSKNSGVMFTCDPVSGEKNRIVIDAVYGLGETIVQGEVTPDHYVVDKESLKIIQKIISKQTVQLIMKNGQTKKFTVPARLQNKQKITDKEIIKIAEIGNKLHRHYFFPQDAEFAIDKDRHLYIVQTRPVTTLKQREKTSGEVKKKEGNEAVRLTKEKKELFSGLAASPGIGWGPVIKIKSKKEIGKVKKGEVMVISMTTPDFVPAMKRVSAIVTDLGGLTSHAAIVSRELGVPCVVGTKIATKILRDGDYLTVDGSNGKVYRGGLPIKSHIIKIPQAKFMAAEESRLIQTATKIYVNLADPSLAQTTSQKNVDGVGLLRAEFMLAEIGVHPKRMAAEGKQKEFINCLAEKIAEFCKAFDPRPVIYRATDFKTNEYRNLKGGELYEPVESNPMLGFRGASRYIVDEETFLMELSAIKKVRNTMGYKNLSLMIPFVRTPEELLQVKKIVVSAGLSRTPSFKLWIMVEVPSNVILFEDFIKVGIDGVSIGSNDLTMLILGTDRDNNEVAAIFDEMNPAVLWALEKVIKACAKEKITCSICGQAPSEYPDLVAKLVEWGVTSISVNPDAIERTREIVYQVEKEILKGKLKKDG